MLKKFKSMITMALLLTAAVAITSCEKVESDDITYVAPSGKFAGEWFVTLKDGGVNALTGVKPYAKLITFNDVNKGDSLWVQTINLSYVNPADKATYTTSFASKALKVKSLTQPTAMNFSVEAGKNIVNGATNKITIVNAKVLPGQGKAFTGTVVDSIYMEVQYSDVPGKTFILSGHQRSGFPADEPKY
ncbi:hypothetical protein NF867_10360 [Solitalea sp. MAHUQ-68]|uniref:Lipid-binding hydrolase n=1 Tax=Solitalea agri TaxID=2953739 RepID=A0A9X2F242_9SPHI|nr:lipid-binding protein [Solitalea agri]MCO4293267.1 hypothetical protein [Solitalea agri]